MGLKYLIVKVELDDIRIAHSALTDKVYAGVIVSEKNKKQILWKKKCDVTNDFIHAVINRWENQTEKISSGENEWEITVKKVK